MYELFNVVAKYLSGGSISSEQMADGGGVEGWKKAVTTKRNSKKEAEKNVKLLSEYWGSAGRNFKVEKRGDGYVVTYEFNLTDKMAKGGGFDQNGNPYGFDYTEDGAYEYHHKPEDKKHPYQVWDKIDGVYVAGFPTRQRAIEWIDNKNLGMFADGGGVERKEYTIFISKNKQEAEQYLKSKKYREQYREDFDDVFDLRIIEVPYDNFTDYRVLATKKDTELAKGGGIHVVLNEGNGKIINDLYNEWDSVKTESENDAWIKKVREAQFGTYGTIPIEEVLEKFNFDEAPINSFKLKSFKAELKWAKDKMADGGGVGIEILDNEFWKDIAHLWSSQHIDYVNGVWVNTNKYKGVNNTSNKYFTNDDANFVVGLANSYGVKLSDVKEKNPTFEAFDYYKKRIEEKRGEVYVNGGELVGKKVKVGFRNEFGIVKDYDDNFITVYYPKLEFTEKINLKSEDVIVVEEHDEVFAKGGGFKVNKKYEYFAVNKQTNKINNGWEIVDDIDSLKYYAKIDLKDNDLDPKDYNILSAKFLKSKGIDPYNWDNWEKSNQYADGGIVDGWRKATTIKKKSKKEAQNGVTLLSEYYGSAGRNYKVEKRGDGYVVTYEFNLTDKMAKGGGFDPNGNAYGFDYTEASNYEYHHLPENTQHPYQVWDKIDGVYVAGFPTRQRAIEWIDNKNLGMFADGGDLDFNGDTYHIGYLKLDSDIVYTENIWAKSKEQATEIFSKQHPTCKIEFVHKAFAKGGSVENKIDELYATSNFINDDFNWKLKLLEMLQEKSFEAYKIYQSLTKKEKEEVLQELYQMDNDMGSDGDGDIEISKENLLILLADAKGGSKYAKGGGVTEYDIPNTLLTETVNVKLSKGGDVSYTKDWEVIYITYQGKKGKKIITLGRKSDKEDVKQALRRMDLNIKEVTSIKEVNSKAETNYIEFLDAKNNFQKTKKDFEGKDSYSEAMEWGTKNLENFSRDMIHTQFAKGGGVKSKKKPTVSQLHKKFSEEKKSIAINIITDGVANKLMHDNNKSVNFEELSEAEKKEFNEYYNKLYNATSKFLLKSFLERYYSDDDTKEKCKGDGVKARDAIYSVVNEIGKAMKFFKFKSSKMEDGGIISSFRLPASDEIPIGLGGIPTYNTPSDIELLRL